MRIRRSRSRSRFRTRCRRRSGAASPEQRGAAVAFRDEFLAGRVGAFVLYVLFKIVIGICVGMATLLITCATCCIAALPYIGTVILLPIFVFDRAYPLYFIGQFGHEWRFFRRPTVVPVETSEPEEEERPPDV